MALDYTVKQGLELDATSMPSSARPAACTTLEEVVESVSNTVCP